MAETMKGTHTAGPWKVVDDSLSLMFDVAITDYDPGTDDFRGIIAGLSQTNQIPLEEQLANARLIAAAPDLLAIARQAEARICALEDADHLTRMEWYETHGLDLVYGLQDAIAKATEGSD